MPCCTGLPADLEAAAVEAVRGARAGVIATDELGRLALLSLGILGVDGKFTAAFEALRRVETAAAAGTDPDPQDVAAAGGPPLTVTWVYEVDRELATRCASWVPAPTACDVPA